MFTFFFSLGKTKKEKKANRQKKNQQQQQQKKQTNREKNPVTRFLVTPLRRYAVTRVLLTTAYHLSE